MAGKPEEPDELADALTKSVREKTAAEETNGAPHQDEEEDEEAASDSGRNSADAGSSSRPGHESERSAGLPKQYTVTLRGIPFTIRIHRPQGAGVPLYQIEESPVSISEEEKVTVRSRLLRSFEPGEIDAETMEEREAVEERFEEQVFAILDDVSPGISEFERKKLAVHLVLEMIGLGKLEIPLKDGGIEELCINSAAEPVWLYHKKHGWMHTNITFESEKEIENVADKIAATYGKEITTAHPILDDARLITGDRAAATLHPISSQGNTITIRKFRREPWTMVDFISPEVGTLTPEIAALVWLAVQYETNILIAGGTASGKTSLLNAALMFVPPEQRIVSIEDVREIRLHKDQHWVPLAGRESEGGEAESIDLLRLMLLALRMRPDRIVLGEVRSTDEAQTLFEAAETGHSVYSTLHATRVSGIFRRLLNPPINVPKSMMSSIQLALVQYRQRRTGIRRTLEAAEIVDLGRGENIDVESNMLYKWQAKNDTFEDMGESKRLMQHIKFFSGLTDKEIEQDLAEKKRILNYMLEHGVRSADDVSRTVQLYYTDKDRLLEMMDRGHTVKNG